VHIGLFAVGFILTGLGITVGYHRMLTHRSFKTHVVLRALLLIFGSMAMEGPALQWAANHLRHHAHADGPGDPHSPNQGLFHSHWGWLFGIGADVDARYAAPLYQDPTAIWVSRTFVLWVILGYGVPFLIAGWDGVIWGTLLRQFVVHNVTFSVNSVCHRWGSQPFNTHNLSRNNWIVGIIGLGEGWHNNHHAFPVSAFHGLRWWELDLSGHLIWLLEAVRLAWDVKRPTITQIQRKLFEPAMLSAYVRAAGPRL
jgi:stearoyl-CoA desaturase (delta-9 desaturase)